MSRIFILSIVLLFFCVYTNANDNKNNIEFLSRDFGSSLEARVFKELQKFDAHPDSFEEGRNFNIDLIKERFNIFKTDLKLQSNTSAINKCFEYVLNETDSQGYTDVEELELSSARIVNFTDDGNASKVSLDVALESCYKNLKNKGTSCDFNEVNRQVEKVEQYFTKISKLADDILFEKSFASGVVTWFEWFLRVMKYPIHMCSRNLSPDNNALNRFSTKPREMVVSHIDEIRSKIERAYSNDVRESTRKNNIFTLGNLTEVYSDIVKKCNFDRNHLEPCEKHLQRQLFTNNKTAHDKIMESYNPLDSVLKNTGLYENMMSRINASLTFFYNYGYSTSIPEFIDEVKKIREYEMFKNQLDFLTSFQFSTKTRTFKVFENRNDEAFKMYKLCLEIRKYEDSENVDFLKS